MKIFFSIFLNALTFFAISYVLNEYRGEGSVNLGPNAWQTYLAAGIILGGLNLTVRPVLRIIGIPFSILFGGLVTLVINIILLLLLGVIINNILKLEGISYQINGWGNFLIAVAIFTILNMVYAILFNKR